MVVVAEIVQLVGVAGEMTKAGRARAHTLLAAGLANPLLKTPAKLKVVLHDENRCTLCM